MLTGLGDMEVPSAAKMEMGVVWAVVVVRHERAKSARSKWGGKEVWENGRDARPL